MAALFQPLKLREIEFRNRIAVSPMCQYSCQDGFSTDWHLVHLGSRAVGGAALVIVEASAVSPEGRISSADLGIWKDDHIEGLARIARFVKDQGAVPGIQIAHAGRKASTAPPFLGGAPVSPENGGWIPVAPSPIPFGDGYQTPRELTTNEVADLPKAFADAAKRALTAGFEVLELHGAHGYLLNSFLSPLTNQRTDIYRDGAKVAVEIIEATRKVWPDHLPLFLRSSASDWVEGGWTIEDSVALAKLVKPLGVDLIDCSSGGMVPYAKIPLGPGYQVPFAEQVRREAGIPTGAVGLITEAGQAEEIIASGKADMVLLAREMLRDPYWPMRAAKALGVKPTPPKQYGRAW